MIQIRKSGTPLKDGIWIVFTYPDYSKKHNRVWALAFRLPGEKWLYDIHLDDFRMMTPWLCWVNDHKGFWSWPRIYGS